LGFYLPVTLMLLALIFRGISIEFRYHGKNNRLWDWGFFLGSLITSFIQGMVAGGLVQQLPVAGGQYAGRAFEWLTPFSLLCGSGLTIGYALLGATWLVLKTEGALRDWSYHRLARILLGAMAVLGLACA
jgi:cytochrome bd ubiquinol oxidase subunit II